MKRIIHLFLLLLVSFLFDNLNCSDKKINVVKIKDDKIFLESIILSAATLEQMRFLNSLNCSARSKIVDIRYKISNQKRMVNSPFDNLTNRKSDYYMTRKPLIEVVTYEVEGTQLKQEYKREKPTPFFWDEVRDKKIDLVEFKKKRLVEEEIRLQKARELYKEILKEKKESAIEKSESKSIRKLQPIGDTRGANWQEGVDKLAAARLLEETKERSEKENKNSIESQKS